MHVVVAPGYERALDAALDFLTRNEALPAAEDLLDRALVFLPELLAKFPYAGRDFVVRNPISPRVEEAVEEIHVLMGTDIELREYLLDDYLVLYAIQRQAVYLLTLRHHRQSGFDLGA